MEKTGQEKQTLYRMYKNLYISKITLFQWKSGVKIKLFIKNNQYLANVRGKKKSTEMNHYKFKSIKESYIWRRKYRCLWTSSGE